MKALTQSAHAPLGGPGSLQRKLTVNIVLALLLAIAMSVTILISEFFEHLEENLEETLLREANEVLVQADPEAENYGLPVQSLRFRGAEGAYRYTVFGPEMELLAGGETSPQIKAQIAPLPLGTAAEIDLPGERRGMALCGINAGLKICVLASAYAPIADTSILDAMWHEVEEQIIWIVLGAVLVLSSALLAARLSLRPLDRVMQQAGSIGPDAPDQRLSPEGLPSEIVPLVAAVNSAFARLEKGYRSQREFSSNVAHEVRTPLAVLHSSVDTIGDAEVRQRLKQDLKQLEQIFEQLIDLARADALEPSTFQEIVLDDLAVQISCAQAPNAIRAGKSLAVTGAKGVRIRGNEGLLAIALDNLVRNALIYSPAGTEVEICVMANPPGIAVLDRGPGVPETEREALFERFNRGSEPGRGKGSGIGLAIVKAVAEAHGARVDIADRDGGGSRFSIEFS
ncbi:two-component hybrid sensor and regulator [Phaeobacter gallaeciensis]|uniref:histidine kinase n=1 Tax=Phaeobacter gallaeciensis TaxID=60890 RepID=A0A1B0ZP48_9RHOB|nr:MULTISPECIES: ATP-binding protein [Phaeobacter]MEE2634049.1 ATP-binding protein [Pseudomonadota bacterium]ANP35891.1 two-component hybrid sensor and regulator [Phaeobacter gallaeciensis]MDE4062355.1 ATP-binding protein [Phaeobacter gallaeciensis]MDE4125227.1 ATP-binding protein [Phaeobacter gallaeciensis]MDE4129935.1 ATP-binding protein [Phaeobacter gallaeciensis]